MKCPLLLSSLLVAAAAIVDVAHARPLFRRQQDGGGSQGITLPPVAPFPANSSQLTIWQLLEQNEDTANFTQVAAGHAPALVQALNNSDPGTNLTAFVPYDSAWEPVVTQPLFQFANSSNTFDELITRLLSYHAANFTGQLQTGGGGGGGSSQEDGGEQEPQQGARAVYTSDLPPPPENVTLPTLAGADVVFQLAAQRPAAPVGVIGGGGGNGGGVGGQQEDQPSPPPPPPQEELFAWAGDALVIVANVTASNGVVHIIDRVLNPSFALPPLPPLTTTALTTTTAVVTVSPPSPSPTV